MGRLLRWHCSPLLSGALALIILSAAPQGEARPVASDPEPAAAESSELAVTAPPSLMHRITVEAVKLADFTETVRLPGRVTLDEHRVARIGPSVTGRVVRIKVFIGQHVHEGDLLAVIKSTELSNAQATFLKAQTRVHLNRLSVDRARRMVEAGVVSERQLTERESELAETEVELRAARDQLSVLGMPEDAIDKLSRTGHIDSLTPVTATLTGTVIERHVSIGQIAQPSDDLFTVADLSQVWIEAEAPEQKAYLAEPGGQAEVHIMALPGHKIIGKVIYVADIVDPATRTVTVRMEVKNPQRRLKPEMLATMVIDRPAVTALRIPARAAVRVGDADYVFVEIAANRFELRPVTLGPEQHGQRRVLDGLTEGQRIVTEGAFHLNNERMRKELE